MVRRILYVLVVAGVIVLAYVGYTRWSENHAMASGEVYGDASEPAGDASSSKATAAAAPATTQPIVYPPAKPAVVAQQAAAPQAAPTPATGIAASSAPSTDSIHPNPPNGTVFAGTGRYQVYRQGNLTWRLDTNTGRACVLLATHEEWKKPEVYRYGCGTSAAQ
jgi:hypothetical protein